MNRLANSLAICFLLITLISGCKIVNQIRGKSDSPDTGGGSGGDSTPTATATNTPGRIYKIYVMGGYDGFGSSYSNTWSFSGGSSWVEDYNFPANCGSTSAVTTTSKIFIIGGICDVQDKIWSSSDSITWNQEASLASTNWRNITIGKK